MNAYELAIELDKHIDGCGNIYSQASNMLRQQADRIAELEKKLKQQTDLDLAKYQEQAAELWNDSCTSNRRSK